MDPLPTSTEFLTTIRGRLGPSYRICADDAFLWLTPFHGAQHDRYAQVARHGLNRLAELIPGLAVVRPIGGWPAVLFADLDAHMSYEGYFGGTGERIISGGSWRSHPIGHLAIPVSDRDGLDAAFAHELVHAVLCPRAVPIWIQEGIACEVETRLGNRDHPYLNQKKLTAAIQYWRTNGPEGFWSAAAFGHPASSTHAYRLAQIIAARWTRNASEMTKLCSREPEQWSDQNSAIGIDREILFREVIDSTRQRGWFERALHRLFVDEQK